CRNCSGADFIVSPMTARPCGKILGCPAPQAAMRVEPHGLRPRSRVGHKRVSRASSTRYGRLVHSKNLYRALEGAVPTRRRTHEGTRGHGALSKFRVCL